MGGGNRFDGDGEVHAQDLTSNRARRQIDDS